MDHKPLIFSTGSYGYMKDQMMVENHFDDGQVERKFFPDGERYQRIMTPPRGRQVYVIAGTISDADTMELVDLSHGLVEQGARRLTVIVPYFSYSTMERDVLPGEVVTAK